MPLVVGGTTISNVAVNGSSINQVYANGTKVWYRPITLVSSGTGTTSASISGVQAGDVIIAFTGYSYTTNITPPTPTGFTSIATSGSGSSDHNTGGRISYKIAAGGETSVSCASTALVVMVFRNVDTSNLFDGSASYVYYPYNIRTANIDCPSKTTTLTGSMVISGGVAYVTGTGSYSGGNMNGLISIYNATPASGLRVACAMAYKQVDNSAFDPSSWNWSGTTSDPTSSGITIALRPKY